MTREQSLSWELTALIDRVNKLSALSHEGKWPAKQVIPTADSAHKVAGHALRLVEILRGWR